MICYRDQTFCASPNCTNQCGRQFTQSHKKEIEYLNAPERWDGLLHVAWDYLCGLPDEQIDQES